MPERLQEAVARALKAEKPKQVFLKKSLGTKLFMEGLGFRCRPAASYHGSASKGGPARAAGTLLVLNGHASGPWSLGRRPALVHLLDRSL